MAEEAGGMVLQLLRAFTVTDVRTGCHRVLSADSSQLPTSLPGTAASLIAWHPQLFLDPTMVPLPRSLGTQRISKGSRGKA